MVRIAKCPQHFAARAPGGHAGRRPARSHSAHTVQNAPALYTNVHAAQDTAQHAPDHKRDARGKSRRER